MEFPTEVVDLARELHSRAKEQASALRAQTEEAVLSEKLWRELERFACLGWSMHLLVLFDKETLLLKKMRTQGNPSISLLEDAYRLAKEDAVRVIRDYPGMFEEACRSKSLPLDSTSRHPRYSLEDGFFQLEIDEKRYLAKLSNHEGRLAEISADIGAVIELIQREHQRIFGRKFDGKKFLKQIRSQYLALVKKAKQTDGASIPIRHITRRLGKNMKSFRTDEFLVDLSRLVTDGHIEIDGRRLDLQQTKDTREGMLLHGAAGRGYIGFVVFREK